MQRLRIIIKTRPGSDSLPVGTILRWHGNLVDIPEGWAVCQGQYLRCSDYPDLFRTLQHRFTPKTKAPTQLTRWEHFLAAFGRKTRRRIPNPDYRPGYFRLPQQQEND